MDNLSLSAETVSGWMLEMCNVYFKHIVCEKYMLLLESSTLALILTSIAISLLCNSSIYYTPIPMTIHQMYHLKYLPDLPSPNLSQYT